MNSYSAACWRVDLKGLRGSIPSLMPDTFSSADKTVCGHGCTPQMSEHLTVSFFLFFFSTARLHREATDCVCVCVHASPKAATASLPSPCDMTRPALSPPPPCVHAGSVCSAEGFYWLAELVASPPVPST